MQFTDHFFLLYFFPIFILIYLSVKNVQKLPNIFIILFSILFYSSFGLINLPILVVPAVCDFFIGKYLEKQKSPVIRTWILGVSITVYIAILAYFKYALLLTQTAETVRPASHLLPILETFFKNLIIPVGISFITFQRISYIFDIYRKKIKASQKFVQYVTYELLFPHLISGPIVRFSDIKEQLAKRKINSLTLFEGMKYFVIGLTLKILVADQLYAVEIALQQNLAHLQTFEALAIVFSFSLRIYTDFCGYSLIAIGLAKMMGFDFPHNFDAPYQSQSITQFWRRWNITLSNWIRDYIYIALGGNRKGNGRTYFNLMVTMLLAGLWHGANWNFMLWGGLHGVYLCVERYFALKKIVLPLPVFLKKAMTFLLVSFTWLTFLFTKPSDILIVLKAIFHFQFAPLPPVEAHAITTSLLAFTLALLWSFVWREDKIDRLQPSFLVSVLLVILLSCSLYMSFWGNAVPFIYFQF